jgi:hypothetical protein
VPNPVSEMIQNPRPASRSNLSRWSAKAVLGLVTLCAWIQVQAQDIPKRDGGVKPVFPMAATGPRSSPFTPPDKDVFLTDASPGLDTGCTFNTSPLNPLTIDIPVDRFVGDVDSNGYLINPAPLVAAGIIPSAVDILLPAFDIDYFGAAPPERDEVLFNGQSLGFLTGDDNVWKLNSFRVDIRKIKFPSRPAPGAQPGAVNNRLQIRIDTLSSGRWCTQVDWVALVVPIRPKLGLDLEVVAGNAMRSDAGAAITKIQTQSFDANCNLSTTVGPIEDYPFSGPSSTAGGGAGSASLRAKIKVCPEGSMKAPDVKADWAVDGTAKRGTLNWNGFEKEVEWQMPAQVGAYTAKLKLTLDNGQVIDASRRLYVTNKPPLIGAPLLNWYKKGTEWANGQSTEVGIVDKVLTGLYGYGSASWIYSESAGTCSWEQLMQAPLSCNNGNCYVFSDVLQNISGTLGVGGMSPRRVTGSLGIGFLTNAAPSLDPAWPGNAKAYTSGSAFDRYLFSTHSLRLRGGTYYDATFKGRYSSERQFIRANLNGVPGSDRVGNYTGTAEGVRIYPQADPGYQGWGAYLYALTPPLAPINANVASNPFMIKAANNANTDLSFAGASAYRTPDVDANGRFEALEVDVVVDVASAGDYVVIGQLLGSNGALVANRPTLNSMRFTTAYINGAAGRRSISLRFSGEQIRESGIDGPYTLQLLANGPNGAAGEGSITTPAYRWAQFGELKARLRSLSPSPLDTDGSGKFETVRVSFEADVVNPGPYQVAVTVDSGGRSLLAKTRLMMLAAGVQQVTLDLPATAIARAGLDGPYDVTVNLYEPTGASIDGLQTQLVGLFATQFEGVVDVNSNLVEQAIDSNGNGLFDLLRVGADVRVRADRTATVYASLLGINGASVAAQIGATLRAGSPQRVNLDFSGPQIRSMQMDSAYAMNLSFRDSATLEEFDAVQLPLRGVYIHTRFDPAEAPRAIALTGTRSDRGVDTNANTLFDKLQIDLGVELLAAGTFDWSARLVDRNGLEIGFATNRGTLAAGVGQIRLEFDGRTIGANGFDGPYFVRSLLISGSGGANLVSPFAGETSAWRANQFESFVVRAPADINGDGVVDAKDLAAFNLALGSGVGEPNYNRFADFDRDGRITLNDLRIFRSYYRR